MKKTLDVEVQYTVTLEYDETSDLFKQTLKDYNEVINSGADEHDMLKQIAWNLVNRGAEDMIEGVGYVAIDGTPQGDPYCGINIQSGFDDPAIF